MNIKITRMDITFNALYNDFKYSKEYLRPFSQIPFCMIEETKFQSKSILCLGS